MNFNDDKEIALYELILSLEGNSRLLSNKDFIAIYSYVNKYIPEIICNPYFFQHYYKKFNPDATNIVIKDLKTFTINYFTQLSSLASNHELYSLGDSLEKFNFVWNMFSEKKIQQIPFSGNIFLNETELNTKTLNHISDYYSLLVQNNNAFHKLIVDIIIGKPVLITDFGAHGKALATLVYILQVQENINIINNPNVLFLISTYDNEEFFTHLYQFLHLINADITDINNIIVIDMDPLLFFTNADWKSSQSRCTPSYPIENWISEPEDVWTNDYLGKEKNYLLCNLGRLMTIMLLCDLLKNLIEQQQI